MFDGLKSGPAPISPSAARVWTSLVLSIFGVGVSTYLTLDHFAKVALACSETGVINCQKVTTSAQSHFLGIPVALLGLVFYIAMTVINLPGLWHSMDRRIHILRLAMGVSGILFVLYLLAAELLIIGNICLWCTSVHVITFILFVLLLSTVPKMLGWGTAPASDA